MNNKDKRINAMVNGHQVTFSFTDEPNIGLERRIKDILLDSLITQNRGVIPQNSNDELEDEDEVEEECFFEHVM